MTDLERLRAAARQGRPFSVGGARRELPPIHVKVEFDDQQLLFGEGQIEMFAHNVGRKLDPADDAFKKLGDDVERETGRVVRGMENVSNSTDKTQQSFLDLGRAGVQPMNLLIGIGVAAGVALAPLIAFTAGLVATVGMLTLVVGGLGLMGAGIIALAEHANNWAETNKNVTTTQAALKIATEQNENAQRALLEGEVALQNTRKPTETQLMHLQDLQEKAADASQKLADATNAANAAAAAAVNPWNTFTGRLDQMAKTLGEQATPLAGRLLNFLTAMIDPVEKVGSSLINWFGPRLTPVLGIVVGLVGDTLNAFDRLGRVVGPVFDSLLNKPGPFQDAYKKFLDIIVQGTDGLLRKWGDLVDWWTKNGPLLEAASKRSLDVVSGLFDKLIKLVGDTTVKMAEGQVAIGRYTDDINNKLAPAAENAAQRQTNTKTATDGLRGALEVLTNIIVTPIRYFADFGQQAADLAGKIAGVTDRFGFLAWTWDHIVRPTLGFLRDELIGLVERGLDMALAPLLGYISLWDRVARAIDWATQKLGWFQQKARSGGGGGGGSFGIDTSAMQYGGMLQPGRWGRVGEVASELLYALPGGGALVVPESGGERQSPGHSVTVNVLGPTTAEDLARWLAPAIRRELLWAGR